MQTQKMAPTPQQKNTSESDSQEDAFTENYLDESTSAIKLLLPPLTGKNILYIGADETETARNIAFSCSHLSAIFTTKQSHRAQLAKNQLRSCPSNMDILFWETQSETSLGSSKFDGIIIDQAIETMDKSRQELNFAHIYSLLDKNAWIFIKAKNCLDRNQLIKALKHPTQLFRNRTIIKSNYRNTRFYKQLLKEHDLVEFRSYGFDHYSLKADNIINLNNKAEVAIFCEHEKFKHIPFWLYQLTTPLLGIFATNYKPRTSPDSILKLVIRDTLKLLDAKKYQIQTIEVNKKCKCVITLEVFRPYSEHIMIKIPLNKLADKHLDHSYRGLELVNNALASNRSANAVQNLFPKALGRGTVDQTQFYIESKLNIIETKKNKRNLINQTTIKRIIDTLLDIRQIPIPQNIDFNNTLHSIQTIKGFINKSYPEFLPSFISLTHAIEKNAYQNNIQYFYKSDFSISNTFIENDKIQGILDFDFWGVSHNKLIDFADFVLSCTRTLYGIQYKEALLAITKGNLSYFPEVLNLEHNINYLNSNLEDFQEAAIIAWLNSIAHLIEFKHIKLNQKRLKPIFLEPLHELIKAQA